MFMLASLIPLYVQFPEDVCIIQYSDRGHVFFVFSALLTNNLLLDLATLRSFTSHGLTTSKSPLWCYQESLV